MTTKGPGLTLSRWFNHETSRIWLKMKQLAPVNNWQASRVILRSLRPPRGGQGSEISWVNWGGWAPKKASHQNMATNNQCKENLLLDFLESVSFLHFRFLQFSTTSEGVNSSQGGNKMRLPLSVPRAQTTWCQNDHPWIFQWLIRVYRLWQYLFL